MEALVSPDQKATDDLRLARSELPLRDLPRLVTKTLGRGACSKIFNCASSKIWVETGKMRGANFLCVSIRGSWKKDGYGPT
jgi:hypothetical protein